MRLILAVLALLPTSALACPQLAGTYDCPHDSTGPANTTVAEQRLDRGITFYAIGTTDVNGHAFKGEYVADGIVHDVANPFGGTMPASFTCEGDAAVRLDAAYKDARIGNVKVKVRFFLDDKRRLHV